MIPTFSDLWEIIDYWNFAYEKSDVRYLLCHVGIKIAKLSFSNTVTSYLKWHATIARYLVKIACNFNRNKSLCALAKIACNFHRNIKIFGENCMQFSPKIMCLTKISILSVQDIIKKPIIFYYYFKYLIKNCLSLIIFGLFWISL